MPDKNYNVDDILREIRRKQGGPSRGTSAPEPEEQKPRSAALREEPPEEDVVEYRPARRRTSRREEPRAEEPRRFAPRADWPEEEDEEEYQPPRRRTSRREEPRAEDYRRAIAASWPEEEKRLPRPRPRREKPDLRAYGKLEEIGEIPGLTDDPKPEPQKEYFPPVKLDLPEAPAPGPTLDDLWQAADTAPVEKPRRAPAPGMTAPRTMWEEDEPPRRSAQTTGRTAPAQPSRPLWEEEPDPRPAARPLGEDSGEGTRTRRPESRRNPVRPLWKEEGRPDIGGETDAPRGLPGGKSDTERFEEQILKTTARAAQAEPEEARGRSALLGFGEEAGGARPKNPIAFGAEDGEDRPRRSQGRPARGSREDREEEEPRPRRREAEEDPR